MQQIFNRITQNIFKFLYKSFHSKAYKHNRRYWPYYKAVRNNEGDLEQLFFNKKLIADHTKPFKSQKNTCVLVATGPSVKNIDQSFHWSVYTFNSNTKILRLNGTNGEATETAFQSTHPTTTIQSLGDHNQNNGSGDTHISYMFCDVPGYQKIGSFSGNSSATDGVFIPLGFRASFFMCKRINTSGHDWVIFNNKALGYNPDNNTLLANSNAAEGTADRMDILSNGVKMYNNNGSENESGGEYIYLAIAESPFVTSTGVPATAR